MEKKMKTKEKVDLVLTNLYRIETKGEATMIMADCIKRRLRTTGSRSFLLERKVEHENKR